MAEDRKKDQKATPDEPPETAKKHDGPKATEAGNAKDGTAGEGAGPHDD
jgi:hypothetical protein